MRLGQIPGALGATALLACTSACTLLADLDQYQSVEPAPLCSGPAPGDYPYQGDGSMRLQIFLGGDGGGSAGGSGAAPLEYSQTLGPSMSAAVNRKDDCCWEFVLRLNENRRDEIVYCPTAEGGLVMVGLVQHQGWDLPFGHIETASDLTCDSADIQRPGMQPGDSWTHLCSGSTSQIEGDYFANTSYTYVGPDTLDIGGTVVNAQRFTEDIIYTGVSTGTRTTSLWLDGETWRPLAAQSVTNLDTPSPYGQVEYDETGNWEPIVP